MSSDQPRPIRLVLVEALAEIRERRARLETYQLKLNGEKAKAEAVIGGLEKLIAGCTESPAPANRRTEAVAGLLSPTAPTPTPPARLRGGELTQLIMECVRTSPDMLTRDEIGERIGHNGHGLRIALGRAVRYGQLVLDVNAYGIPPVVGADL